MPEALIRAERRLFVREAPMLGLAAALCAFCLALVLLALGRSIFGLVVLVAAIATGAFFVSAARRLADWRVAGAVAALANQAQWRVGFAWVSVSSWSRARREVMRLHRLQRQVWRRQRELIYALGEAVYRDEARAEALKNEARACDAQIQDYEQAVVRTLEASRQHVRRERVAGQPTEVHAGKAPEILRQP